MHASIRARDLTPTIYKLPWYKPSATGPSEHGMVAIQLDIDQIGGWLGHAKLGIFVKSDLTILDKHVRWL